MAQIDAIYAAKGFQSHLRVLKLAATEPPVAAATLSIAPEGIETISKGVILVASLLSIAPEGIETRDLLPQAERQISFQSHLRVLKLGL